MEECIYLNCKVFGIKACSFDDKHEALTIQELKSTIHQLAFSHLNPTATVAYCPTDSIHNAKLNEFH